MMTATPNPPGPQGPPNPYSPHGVQDAPVTAASAGATTYGPQPLAPRPPERRVGWRIAAVAVTALLSLGAAGSFASPMVQQRATRTTALSPDTRLLVLNGPSGDVHIRVAGPGEKPQARVAYSYAFEQDPVRIVQRNGRAEVTASCVEVLSSCSADWDITLPAKTDVESHMGASDLIIDGIAGELRLEQGAGDLQVRDSRSPQMSIRSGVGDVSVNSVVPVHRLLAQAGTGDLTIKVPTGPDYDITAEAGAGTTNVEIPDVDGATNRIEAQAGVGDVRVLPR